MKNSILIIVFFCSVFAYGQKKSSASSKPEPVKADLSLDNLLKSMPFRGIGPAVTSGRISDLAINPKNTAQWYVAVACGGVWKTDNAGTNFYPIFDNQGSFSIGCITIDPLNQNTIWVGTGENNNQRSVAFGDGVYKSEDGGKTWKNMGLKNSEHIGMVAVDPSNSNTVYVAAYGPLWSSGGDRGIYKSTDGGNTWTKSLFVSDNTGFNEVHIDPLHPNIVYATAHQRRRHEWTYLGGGPESALYKSTDYGLTWKKLENGLPKGDIGRIALAISPVNTDIVYALIEANDENKGLYYSSDRGASFEKRSSYATSGNYYMEIFADPIDINKIYSMNTWAEVSTDGGRSFQGLGENNKHVDNHAIWVDRSNTSHILMGCDGGLYETWDEAKTWDFKSNLPITQFYRVTVDNASPFYNIYGGTQDNNTLGGPSRTISASGIHNTDWFVTVGGDGFKTVVDPTDPNIVYSQWQYGGLIRFNKKTGEVLDIKPQEMLNEEAFRFNWDAPIVLSHHNNKTLYFAAQKIFKSTDMGSTWERVSPDLSAGIDRNKLPVMGKVWSMDAIAKNQSTSIYGNITALAESPKDPMVLFAGTDDGLIQITSDGGKTWNKISKIAGIPEQTLVQNIYASKHDVNVAYAVFNNHRNGDFKPYIVKTTDRGKTWTMIQSNLPERGSVQCIAEDHTNKDLLFAGTDFNLFVSVDGGKSWNKYSTGLPIINIKDIAIQERENDLVLGTFGRGFYILDDYSPLQNFSKLKTDIENKAAFIYPIKDGLVYIPSTPLGHKGKSFQGESFYTAANPPIGAVITYNIKNDYKSLKSLRKEKEEKQSNQFYPSKDSIRLEDYQAETYILAIISDNSGNIVRQYKQAAIKGTYRLVWDGRMERTSPITFYKPNPNNPYESEDQGPLALPGEYTIVLKLVNAYEIITLSDPVKFTIKTLFPRPIESNAFNTDISDFRRVVLGVNSYCYEMHNRLNFIKNGLHQIQDQGVLSKINSLELQIQKLQIKLHGDGSLASREFEVRSGFIGSLEGIVWNLWATSQTPTGTYISKLNELKLQFNSIYKEVLEIKLLLEQLEADLEKREFPYTPGRLPEWKG